ncbi:MAG: Cof-type HAD-IIB family hydrolase [Chloroflexi bacterium]|nr:Cof-type HAD-IIB family hydrolase [Chloroflexota bacterium]
MPPKLIAFDLDGTLLRDDLSLSPRVAQALAQVQRAGVLITLASGRGFPALKPWAAQLHITAPVIGYQGASITDPLTERVICEYPFPRELLDELVEYARECDLSLTVYADDEIYVERKRHSDAFYDKWFGLPIHVVADLRTALPADPIKFLITATADELDILQPEVVARFGRSMQIVRSHPLFLEGLALGVTKGTALAWVARHLWIAQSDTIAFGDSGNDVEMLAWAGIGVAMGNASPEALRAADLVVPSVDEDGVAVALERLVLQVH